MLNGQHSGQVLCTVTSQHHVGTCGSTVSCNVRYAAVPSQVISVQGQEDPVEKAHPFLRQSDTKVIHPGHISGTLRFACPAIAWGIGRHTHFPLLETPDLHYPGMRPHLLQGAAENILIFVTTDVIKFTTEEVFTSFQSHWLM